MDDYTPTTTPTRRRRRALLWGFFGLTGLLMSAAWAAGFVDSDSDLGNVANAADQFGVSAAETQTVSPYQGKATDEGQLSIDFDGPWGEIAADTPIFEVNLTGLTGTFYFDIFVDNLPFVQPWEALQLKWQRFDGACAGASFDGSVAANGAVAADPKLMNVTTTDAHVSFTALAGGDVYCFGISDTDEPAEAGNQLHADDEAGTYMLRANGTTPDAPDFTAVVNRNA